MMLLGDITSIITSMSLITNYLYLIALPSFVITSLCILNDELHDMALTRGFHGPTSPRVDENHNWTIQPTTYKSLLLGTININPNANT